MNPALFNPQGPIAAAEIDLIKTMVFLMLIIVVPMFILLFTFARKYRAGNAKAQRASEAAIPAALVAVLAVFSWGSVHAVDPYAPIPASEAAPGAQPITIQVVALPWKWLFIYPAQNIATVNFIQFPVGTPVHFELTADAPMSSFWIPQLGSQIYAMAAMETQLNLEADKIGEFVGKDTEINGAGYAGMQFMAKSSSQEDFDAWVATTQSSSTYAPLTMDAYNALAAPSENNPATFYSSVEGDLFDNIMMKYMMPSSTPMPGMSM